MNDRSVFRVQSSEFGATEHDEPHDKRQIGFTLLEVLIALGIMSVIMTVIYTSFSTAGRNVEQAEARRDLNDLARTLMMKLSDDIANAYVNPLWKKAPTIFRGKKVLPDPVNEKIRQDEIYLTTKTDPVSHTFGSKEIDLWEVGYYFKQKPEGAGFVLMRKEKRELSEDSPVLEGGVEYALTDRVTSLQFRYHNGFSWADEWSNTAIMPYFVEIAFMLDDGSSYITQVDIAQVR
jgi:prepilin-type N-terminal cleavage/methylation domain-containing protein